MGKSGTIAKEGKEKFITQFSLFRKLVYISINNIKLMAQHTFTEAESWNIIQEMIAHAKQEVRNDRYYYLLWGWLVLVASLAHYLLLNTSFQHPYAVWLLMLLGAIGTVQRSVKAGKKQKVRTYVDRFIINVWIAISVGIGGEPIGGRDCHRMAGSLSLSDLVVWHRDFLVG